MLQTMGELRFGFMIVFAVNSEVKLVKSLFSIRARISVFPVAFEFQTTKTFQELSIAALGCDWFPFLTELLMSVSVPILLWFLSNLWP